jgi:acyl dehydratase
MTAIALANAIERLHQDQAVARQLGLAARARSGSLTSASLIRQTLAV